MQQEHRLTVPAQVEKIEAACRFIADIAERVGMGDDAIYHCYLAVEEVCTNIIEHGYFEKHDNQSIDIYCQPYSDRLVITIADDARPFNPLEHQDPDPSAPLAEREGGGWGIFFVKKFIDKVAYRYHNDRNHLTLEKRY
jgi:serine/threonine-protein kinase RsbW